MAYAEAIEGLAHPLDVLRAALQRDLEPAAHRGRHLGHGIGHDVGEELRSLTLPPKTSSRNGRSAAGFSYGLPATSRTWARTGFPVITTLDARAGLRLAVVGNEDAMAVANLDIARLARPSTAFCS